MPLSSQYNRPLQNLSFEELKQWLEKNWPWRATTGAKMITADEILADTITANEIAASTITTTELNFIPATSTNVIASINASAEGINIDADNIAINGDCTFTAGYDPTGKIAAGGAAQDVNDNATTISGGKITANSIEAAQINSSTITTTELNFTPVQDTDVIAKINASAEGITIDADNLTIASTTTFTSGWAAASNAESDINALNTTNGPAEASADVTGSNTANDTSNVNGLAASSVSGWAHGSDTTKIDGGDIYTNTVTATQISVSTLSAIVASVGNLEVAASGDIHSTGKDSFSDTTAGFWIGDDSGTFKFIIGDATSSMSWDGSTLSVTGAIQSTATIDGLAASKIAGWKHASDDTKMDGGDIYQNSITATQINANTITASEIQASTITATELGTITGATIQTASSGARCVMDSTSFRVYDSSAQKGQFNTDGNLEGTSFESYPFSTKINMLDGVMDFRNGASATGIGINPTTPSVYVTGVTAATMQVSNPQGEVHIYSSGSKVVEFDNSDANFLYDIRRGDTQVVTTRQTGWTAWTGTASRATRATSSPPSNEELAQAIKALIDDLITHGLIGT